MTDSIYNIQPFVGTRHLLIIANSYGNVTIEKSIKGGEDGSYHPMTTATGEHINYEGHGVLLNTIIENDNGVARYRVVINTGDVTCEVL